MKANSCGTMVEQSRARMGWKTATERKATYQIGDDPAKTCRGCKFFSVVPYKKSDESFGLALRCIHLRASGDGFATRETAGCDAWERKLT